MRKYQRMQSDGSENGINTSRDGDTLSDEQPNSDEVSSSNSVIQSYSQPKWRSYAMVAILTLINMLNYMDRFTIPGVLTDVLTSFNLSDAEGGALQTVFICSYMVFAPLFGYLGDRYSRKWIIVAGMTVWCCVTFGSSFVPNDAYWLLLITRGLVGIGESSYITVSPSMVGDVFSGNERFLMITIIYFAVPVGSGMGYLIGAQLASAFKDWRYALRFTPLFGAACVVLLIIFVREPVRGLADRLEQPRSSATVQEEPDDVHGETHEQQEEREIVVNSTRCSAVHSWLADVRAIVIVPSFMLNTIGFTAVCFVAGALSWWSPIYLSISFSLPTAHVVFSADNMNVAFAFGVLTCVAGFVGVGSGLLAARFLRPRYGMRADPLSCATGLLLAGPIVYVSLILAPYNDLAVYLLIFFGEACLCLSWALNTDIMLRVIVPSRRSSANAIGMLISHLLGDALCPLLIGAISGSLIDRICSDRDIVGCSSSDINTVPKAVHCIALMYSLFVNSFVCVLGGCSYLFCSLKLERDAYRMESHLASQRRAVQHIN